MNSNCFAIKKQELLQYMINDYDKTNVDIYSNEKVSIKCPDCGFTRKIKAKYFAFGKKPIPCPNCSDGISYPNKFIYSFLKQLGVDYESEYSPDWIGNKRFDSYFKKNNKEYIIEMDGGFHYVTNTYTGETVESVLKIDKEKEKIAEDHEIIVIRIKSHPSDLKTIKENIINSELNHIFDLSIIDWNKCDYQASKSIIIDICNYYNQNNYTIKELCGVFDISPHTAAKYLSIGADSGICKYVNKDQRSKERYLETIRVYNEDPSLSERELSEIIGVNRNMIRTYLIRGNTQGLCVFIKKEDKIKAKERVIKDLMESDKTFSPSDIIRITGFPSTTVRRIIRRIENERE